MQLPGCCPKKYRLAWRSTAQRFCALRSTLLTPDNRVQWERLLELVQASQQPAATDDAPADGAGPRAAERGAEHGDERRPHGSKKKQGRQHGGGSSKANSGGESNAHVVHLQVRGVSTDGGVQRALALVRAAVASDEAASSHAAALCSAA